MESSILMKIKVDRTVFTEMSTISPVSVDGKFFCYSLEDKDRRLELGNKKVYGKTAIPRGSYHVTITWSNHFQKYLPLILGVPGFDGVRIHAGNKAEDTEGCLLVGESYSTDMIYDSRSAFNRLFDLIEESLNKGEPVELEIV
jgi:hypothetical protein